MLPSASPGRGPGRGLRLASRAALACAAIGSSLLGCACRGEAQFDRQVEETTKRLIPAVERAAGLPFRRPPVVAIRARDQVAAYLEAKLADDLPPEKLDQITLAYRLFGLIPDTLELHRLLLSLYAEQVVGYFDPDSNALYVVRGIDRVQVSLVLAHELVHALQAQYVALDSLLDPDAPNDVVTAAQAVLEGQATLVSVQAMMPGQDLAAMPDFWGTFRQAVTQQYAQMPVFSSAPAIVRETLIFPYLAGAHFVHRFRREYPDTVPFGSRLPSSTEQVLHFERYAAGDVPTRLAYSASPDLRYQDGLGEFEIRVLLRELAASETAAQAAASGWDGDQYGIFLAAGGEHALVWTSVWDDAAAAARFAGLVGSLWHGRAGRRTRVDRLDVGGMPGVRLVDAPVPWERWGDLPSAVRVP